jgi:hypothetical protein
MVTDDCGSGPWPLPVCFDPDDTGSTVCTRDFYQWRDLWQLSSWQAKKMLPMTFQRSGNEQDARAGEARCGVQALAMDARHAG